jgi:polysaccharide deacetylase family protein (PEP-CTERM system associated)
VAERCPDLVKTIASHGHEIASHGFNHQHLSRMTPALFREDLQKSIRILEDATGTQVWGYRAPTFSIIQRTAWAIDVLRASTLKYDSSIYPVRHDRYGVSAAPIEPFDLSRDGDGSLIEIPPLVGRCLGMNLPLGGGGYLRLLPIAWMSRAILHANREGRPAMTYVHPWEIDPDQPTLPCGRLTRIRHYRNLDQTMKRLGFLFDQHEFTTANRVLESYRSANTIKRWNFPAN